MWVVKWKKGNSYWCSCCRHVESKSRQFTGDKAKKEAEIFADYMRRSPTIDDVCQVTVEELPDKPVP